MMSEITLEKIDIIRERTGASYADAKSALEAANGNVVDALIQIEESKKAKKDNIYNTKDEFTKWLKEVVEKGNVNRIRVKKDEKVIVDVPVTAGLAAAVIGIIVPAVLGIGIVAALVTKVTIEIVKDDGSVEVVNKIIKTTVDDVKDKVEDMANTVKDKFSRENEENKQKDENIYKYTVKFEEIKDDDKE